MKIRLVVLGLLALGLIGCGHRITAGDKFSRISDDYFHKAVQSYETLLLKGKDTSRVHLELGKLYYLHGDFEEAKKELLGSNEVEAKKFLGIIQYKLGNYTDALDYFRKLEPWDDSEYLYYYGETCEKLNLYDRALALYKKVSAVQYQMLSDARIAAITKSKQTSSAEGLDTRLKEILRQAPSQEMFPQAGALILYAEEAYEVSAQDTLTSSGYFVVKILNERGKKEFSEIQTDYDSTYEKVELEFARVIKPDGTVVDVGSKHIRDVSKYLNFPLYSNVRVHIISLPEIAEGAVIVYKIKVIKNQLINKKDFYLAYPLQASEPIMHAKFTLRIPEARQINVKVLNKEYNHAKFDFNPKVTKRNGYKECLWEFRNIAQIMPEANMPAATEVNPTLALSTFNNWLEVYSWWWNLAKDKISAGANIKRKTSELTKDLKGEEEKARAIYNFCAKDIRYVAVEYGEAGYEPHKAEDIFLNKYGDCKDQAVLLVAMLREAGLKAYPVLIGTRDYYNLNEDLPSPLFNHAIAAVEIAGKLIFMDPTAETCSFGDLPPGDQARKVLLFREDAHKIVATPLFGASHNVLREEAQIKIANSEAITAQRQVSSSGAYDQNQRYWLTFTPPKLIEEALKEKIQNISIGARLAAYNVENVDDLDKEVILNYSFSGPEYFTVAGDIRILPQLSSIDTTLIAQEERNYPIDMSVPNIYERKTQIILPDDFSLKFLPATVEKDSPWLRYKAEYLYKDGSIFFNEIKEWKTNLVRQDVYLQFKRFIEDSATLVKQRIVLEKKK